MARRISLVGPAWPLRGGIAQHTVCLARALETAGAQVQLVSYRRLYPRPLFPGRTERDDSARPLAFPGTEQLLLPESPASWLAALQSIRRFDPELVVVVHWHSWQAPAHAALLSALRFRDRRRTALLCHNLASHEARIDGPVTLALTALPSVVVVHGAAQAAQLRRRRNVVRVPHPVYDAFLDGAPTREEARRRLGIDAGARVCLAFGLVRRYKGIDVAVDAVARASDVQLLIAGELYVPRVHLDAAVARAGARVIVHDRFVRNEDVGAYFRAADLLLLPYSGSSHSGVLQIGRAFGVPAVVAAGSGLVELVDDGVTGIVAARTGGAFAGAIDRFFREPGLQARMSAALLASVERYSWASLADAILARA